jgi:hypothetical protein
MQVQIDVPLAGLPADRKLSHVVAKCPEIGDWYLDCENEWNRASIRFHTVRIVARFEPIEVWRPATIDDAIRALQGEEIPCRVWDWNEDNKIVGFLAGAHTGDKFKWLCRYMSSGAHNAFNHCEIKEFKE